MPRHLSLSFLTLALSGVNKYTLFLRVSQTVFLGFCSYGPMCRLGSTHLPENCSISTFDVKAKVDEESSVPDLVPDIHQQSHQPQQPSPPQEQQVQQQEQQQPVLAVPEASIDEAGEIQDNEEGKKKLGTQLSLFFNSTSPSW